MKKLMSFTIAMVLLSILSGCLGGSGEPKTYTSVQPPVQAQPSVQPSVQTYTLTDETKTINADVSWAYGFEIPEGAEIEIELKVLSGGAIDAFLMDSSNYAGYSYISGGGTGEFEYIVDGSSVSTKAFKKKFAVPPGTYYFVVDNTPMSGGGATPTGSVDAKIKVIAKSPVEEGQIGQVATQRAVVKEPGFSPLILETEYATSEMSREIEGQIARMELETTTQDATSEMSSLIDESIASMEEAS